MEATTEIASRVVKYLVEGLVVAAFAIFIPKKSIGFDEVLMNSSFISCLRSN
jgi:hypothetical protein